MNETSPLKLLLAEDDDALRKGYAELLSRNPGVELVGVAEDGCQALAVMAEHLVDVALLDVEMPRMDGIQAAAQIVRQYPSTAVVMFTAFDAPERVEQALRAGARGFLTKDLGPEQIVDSLRQAVRGVTVLGARPMETVVLRLGGGEASELRALAEAIDTLPSRLLPVLREVALGKNNKEIAAALSISEGTVRTYVTELLRRCGCASRTELAVKTIRAGKE
ncbi:response regulator [Actinomyces trachealis]|uniref:response regulator n=1 Tax=Actinomyces trachealis TaxID=2763540 RepID=UPI0018C7AF3E|nr:response regulator transcription factor [Actinomyces trachealis]